MQTGSIGKNIEFGLTLPICPIEENFWVAQFADKNGFYSISTIDHIVEPGFPYVPEAFLTLSSISMITRRVRMMTGVSDPHRRHPALMAQSVATLDRISQGRFTLGLGAGEAMNLEPYGFEWRRSVSKLREYILVLRQLWTRKPVTFEGEFFKLKNAKVEIETSQQPHPPIWLGALSPKTLEITGELADGWFPTTLPASDYESGLKIVRDSAKKFGKDPDKITPAVELAMTVSNDHESAEKRMLPFGKMFIQLFPQVLRNLGYSKLASESLGLHRLQLTPESNQELNQAAEQTPTEAVENVCGFGTPDECIAFLERYVNAGATHFTLIPIGEAKFVKETILPLLVQRVIPYFQETKIGKPE